jgi:hypothetical protein
MTTPLNKNSHPSATDDAWAKMQQALANEPVNPVWEVWGQQTQAPDAGIQGSEADIETINTTAPVQELQEMQTAVSSGKQEGGVTMRRPKMSRRRKWAVTAAAAAILGVVLATPVGNTAMAAILNQFRMQEAAVVNESDLRNIFYQMNEDGTISEAVNKFGTFTSSSGGFGGELPAGQMQEKLGYSPISGDMFDSITNVYVSHSQDATLILNVDAVNQALQRLGSDQLLPESVDGKPITLHMPESVNYDLSTGNNQWANLTQMNTPTIIVDPSIDVEEALKAVLNFPLLPDQWKTNLQQSRVLSGELPMPLLKGEFAEELTIGGTLVIVNTNEYSEGPVYHATWVKDGQLFDFSGGNLFKDKEKFLTQLQELISQ